MGHTWLEATYTAPKTCEFCGETEGNSIPVCVEKKFSTSLFGNPLEAKYSYEFEYNGDGKKIKELQYDAEDGELIGEIFFEYDADGNLIKGEGIDIGISYTITYEYDEDSNVIVENIIYKGLSERTITYKYDMDGKRIAGYEEGIVYMGMNASITVTDDATGETIGDTTEHTSTTEYTHTIDYAYEYNADGKLVKKVWNWSDGTVATTGYEYDADGNLIKEVYTDGDGIGVEVTEYTYGSLN